MENVATEPMVRQVLLDALEDADARAAALSGNRPAFEQAIERLWMQRHERNWELFSKALERGFVKKLAANMGAEVYLAIRKQGLCSISCQNLRHNARSSGCFLGSDCREHGA